MLAASPPVALCIAYDFRSWFWQCVLTGDKYVLRTKDGSCFALRRIPMGHKASVFVGHEISANLARIAAIGHPQVHVDVILDNAVFWGPPDDVRAVGAKFGSFQDPNNLKPKTEGGCGGTGKSTLDATSSWQLAVGMTLSRTRQRRSRPSTERTVSRGSMSWQGWSGCSRMSRASCIRSPGRVRRNGTSMQVPSIFWSLVSSVGAMVQPQTASDEADGR